MKRCKLTVAVCVAFVILSMSITATASATLTPEFMQHGKPIGSINFEGTASGIALETKAFKVVCFSSTTKGSAATATTVSKVVIKWADCEEAGGFHSSCTTHGDFSGEIVSESLKGRLGGINSSPDEVGLLLEAEAGLSTPVTSFECSTLSGSIHDQVIGLLEPLKVEQEEFGLFYTCKGAGTQTLTLFEKETEPHNLVFFYPSLEKEDLCLTSKGTYLWKPSGTKVEIHP